MGSALHMARKDVRDDWSRTAPQWHNRGHIYSQPFREELSQPSQGTHQREIDSLRWLPEASFQTPLGEIGFAVGSGGWWSGPNVCIERKQIDESASLQNQTDRHSQDSYMTTSCHESEIAFTCTSRVRSHGSQVTHVLSYRCCIGFRRMPGQYGCQEADVKEMVSTLQDLGGQRFLNLVESNDLTDIIRTKNLTIFCPVGEAIEGRDDNIVDNDVIISEGRIVRSAPNEASMVLGHMVPGYENAADFIDEKVLMTENGETGIRINVYDYPEKTVTTNCARVLTVNHYATNGIVHMVDGMITPATKTVIDIISSDPQFSILKAVINQAGMVKMLRQNGQYTVFAPTDTAFSHIDQALVHRMMRGEHCTSSIIKNHILPNVICSTVMQGFVHTKNMLKNNLRLHRIADDKIFVNDAQVVAKDLMGTNGIVHVIDGVILPDEAKSIPEKLEEFNLTRLVEAIQEVNLMSNIESMTNVTMFAPSDEAFKELPTEYLNELRRSPSKMREMLLYHVATPQVSVCDFENNQRMDTKLHGKSIRINLFSSFPFFPTQATAQCGQLIEMDVKACESKVHIINKVLVPPEGNIPYILASNGSFGILRRLLRDTGYEDTISNSQEFTLLAPTDAAFYDLPEEVLHQLMRDREMATRVLSNHIIPGIICCTSINRLWLLTDSHQTTGGQQIVFYKNSFGTVHVANARITKCDMMAENGVIHAINRVIQINEQGFNSSPFSHSSHQTQFNPDAVVVETFP